MQFSKEKQQKDPIILIYEHPNQNKISKKNPDNNI